MKRLIIAALMALCTSAPAWACDVCGCSASNQYLGLLPGYEYNFMGLQYLRSYYSGYHPSVYENKPFEHSRDYYNTIQLWGRYNIKHFQVFVFVPYQFNQHRQDSANANNSGIGDISLLVNRKVWGQVHGNTEHLLTAGIGIKLPTGHHEGISVLDRLGLPNMQPGTGSTDFPLYASYTVRYKKTGVNADASYVLTTTSRDNYKYGNRLATGALLFYTQPVKAWTLIPACGMRYEFALHDYDNYRRKWLNETSGGFMLFATAGLQAYYNKTGVRFTFQLPVSQNYASGYVNANNKLELSFFRLF